MVSKGVHTYYRVIKSAGIPENSYFRREPPLDLFLKGFIKLCFEINQWIS